MVYVVTQYQADLSSLACLFYDYVAIEIYQEYDNMCID